MHSKIREMKINWCNTVYLSSQPFFLRKLKVSFTKKRISCKRRAPYYTTHLNINIVNSQYSQYYVHLTQVTIFSFSIDFVM